MGTDNLAMRLAMLTWVIVVLLNELAVGQKILILNVVNGQTPNVSQLYQATNTTTTAHESTDETTTAQERTDEQFLGRQQQEKDSSVTCQCRTPVQGTVNKNGFDCTDGTKSWCEANEECYSTSFPKEQHSMGCRAHEPCNVSYITIIHGWKHNLAQLE